jgi:hypothetical protein
VVSNTSGGFVGFGGFLLGTFFSTVDVSVVSIDCMICNDKSAYVGALSARVRLKEQRVQFVSAVNDL